MAAHPATLSRKSFMLFRFVGSSRISTPHLNSQSRISANPYFISASRSSSSSSSSSSISCFCNYDPVLSKNSNHGLVKLGQFPVRLRLPGLSYFRISAVQDSDSGGGSSGRGSGGDGDSGGSGGGSGGGGKDDWSFVSWYLSLLEKYPVLTKAVTSALLTLVGDVICQIAIDQNASLDVKRTFLFTLLGLVLVGPTLHFWYLFLSNLVKMPGASGAFFRLILDQFLFSPIFIGVFLSTLVTLEGRPSDVIPKLRQEWFSSVLANWQLWIPFQFLNFRFVPQQFQVLAANFIALIWNVILSYKAHKEVITK